MRRLLALLLAGGALAAAVAVLGGCGGDEPYRVRAIFDNAAFVVRGEDVKVAGVKVGQIDSLHVTADKKAAVVLDIDDPGFQDFRRDATCTIRPQSLIGEQFVECTPTQPRASTDPLPPPLERIRSGPGEGERLLPVQRTSASVALDLVADISRLPVRQRLTLLLNELGTGLAGRGHDLNDVIRRAAPALTQFDQVLDILAKQNRTLERLAVDSDRALGPLARERRHVTGFVTAAARTAAATAERRADLEQDLRRLPGFLAELRPTMRRLGAFAEQSTPVVRDLHASATGVDDVLRNLGPFSAQATPALRSLGEVGRRGIPAIRAALPVQHDLRRLARSLRPVSGTLADVLASFQRNDGIPRALKSVFYTALATNGFDSVSHFLRAGLLVNTCSSYAVDPQTECLSKFSGFGQTVSPTAASASASAAPGRRAAGTRAPEPAGSAEPASKDGTAEVLDYLFGKDGP